MNPQMNLPRPHRCGMSTHNQWNNEAAATTSLPHLNAGASALNDHYEMMADSDPHTNPRPVNGIDQRPGSVGEHSEGRGRNASEALLNPHPDCERLERSNRRMAVVFWCLAVVCIFVVLVYVGVIIFVFVSMARMDSDQSSRSSGSRDSSANLLSRERSSPDPQKYCVHESKIEEFKNIWDPEDQKDIEDLLKDVGFVFTSSSRTFCFTSLQWVPQIMGKIHSKVQESVSYVEDQQKKINQTVNRYTSANNTASQCSTPETQASEEKGPVDPSNAVYAHYFIKTTHDYSYEKGVVPVVLSHAGQMSSSKERIGVTTELTTGKETGQFTVWNPGFYFVYTRLLFKESHPTVHRVVKIRNNRRSTLLESGQGRVSSLQGVFRLHFNDTLLLEASASSLDLSRDRVSYYGAYLIRT